MLSSLLTFLSLIVTTTALDKLSERLIVKSIERLRDNGLTIVSVTHHPATALKADSIIILDNGAVVQQGSYNELSSQNGLFSNLIRAERRKSSKSSIVVDGRLQANLLDSIHDGTPIILEEQHRDSSLGPSLLGSERTDSSMVSSVKQSLRKSDLMSSNAEESIGEMAGLSNIVVEEHFS